MTGEKLPRDIIEKFILDYYENSSIMAICLENIEVYMKASIDFGEFKRWLVNENMY